MTVHNFNAGPAVLPAEVIAQIQAELPDYAGTGMSILESSHRSKAFEAIAAERPMLYASKIAQWHASNGFSTSLTPTTWDFCRVVPVISLPWSP